MGYVAVTGGRVWFEIIGDGPGVPVVLLHGGPGFQHGSFASLRGLGADRPVVLYDQLGSGRSDHPDDPALWQTDRFVAELAQIRAALGLSDCHLLGHSWGAMLLAAYMHEQPSGVRSVVFSSGCLDAQRWAADQAAYVQQLPDEMQQAIAAVEAGGSVDAPGYKAAMDEFYRRHYCRITPWPAEVQDDFDQLNAAVYEQMWGPAEFYATGSLKDFDATPWLPDIHVPVLFTCGRYDEATPQSTARYQSRVTGAQFHVFEHSGHMTYVEESEAYLQVVGGFLRSSE